MTGSGPTGRFLLIEELAARICLLKNPHTLRVAIDGVDGAGKTTLADELVEPVRRLGRRVIRASVDDFHRPELLPHWDLSMFLWVPSDVAIARAAGRAGTCSDVDASENRRYVLGQKLYIEECRPASRAGILIDNTDLADPRWRRA